MSYILTLLCLILVVRAQEVPLEVPDPGERGAAMAPGNSDCLGRAELAQIEELQHDALRYFIENQLSHGLILDRQRNHGPRSLHGLCSTSGTGMGLIAIALASAPEYKLLSRHEAIARVRRCLKTALEKLPHDHGIMPHFVDSDTLAPVGEDRLSTIDSAWLAGGALWAAEFLDEPELKKLANELYRRIDWQYWAGDPQAGEVAWLSHGSDKDGKFLPTSWDRLNGETAFLYVLAIGAPRSRALPPGTFSTLRKRYGAVAGSRFVSADLGLFAFQYSLQLLDFRDIRWPGKIDLFAQARLAVQSNYDFCRSNAGRFRTYKRFWGVSAGDGPGESKQVDVYRAYCPQGPVDGTAHLTATLASIDLCPELVAANLRAVRAWRPKGIHGRYGLSNVNRNCRWVSRDVVAIDLGAEVMAIDNFLNEGRVRATFHKLACVKRALKQLHCERYSDEAQN